MENKTKIKGEGGISLQKAQENIKK